MINQQQKGTLYNIQIIKKPHNHITSLLQEEINSTLVYKTNQLLSWHSHELILTKTNHLCSSYSKRETQLPLVTSHS